MLLPAGRAANHLAFCVSSAKAAKQRAPGLRGQPRATGDWRNHGAGWSRRFSMGKKLREKSRMAVQPAADGAVIAKIIDALVREGDACALAVILEFHGTEAGRAAHPSIASRW